MNLEEFKKLDENEQLGVFLELYKKETPSEDEYRILEEDDVPVVDEYYDKLRYEKKVLSIDEYEFFMKYGNPLEGDAESPPMHSEMTEFACSCGKSYQILSCCDYCDSTSLYIGEIKKDAKH